MDVTGTDTVILITREVAGVDRYGNDVRVDSETTVPYCSVQPMWGAETTNAAEQVTDRYQLILPGLSLTDLEIDPGSLDAVRYAGRLYEINGEPQEWRLDGATIDHVVIYLRRVTG